MDKTRITVMFATNATGTEKRQPLIIGRSLKPRAFSGRTADSLGLYYRVNAKAWMTGDIYGEWIRRWDAELAVIYMTLSAVR